VKASIVPAAVGSLLALLATGCISGRVLNGYPGYPFVSFAVPQPPDSAFFGLQGALEDEGYPIDYTERASGFMKTRVGPGSGQPLFLSLVVAGRPSSPDTADVWISGFALRGGDAQRINPNDSALWQEVVGVSERISGRLGGTTPAGPAD